VSEAAVAFGQLTVARAEAIVDDVRAKYPDLSDFQLVCQMAAALGCAMGRESFPNMPHFEMQALFQIVGASAGLAMARMQDGEKKSCLGSA